MINRPENNCRNYLFIFQRARRSSRVYYRFGRATVTDRSLSIYFFNKYIYIRVAQKAAQTRHSAAQA